MWQGPLLLDDELLGLTQGFMTVPGADVGLLAVLSEDASGAPLLALQGVGPADPETGENETLFLATIPQGVTTDPEVTAGQSITWDSVGSWTGMQGRPAEPGPQGGEAHAALRRAIPLGRYGDTAEIGRVAAFLLSPAASYSLSNEAYVRGGFFFGIGAGKGSTWQPDWQSDTSVTLPGSEYGIVPSSLYISLTAFF